MTAREPVLPVVASSWANVAQDYWDGLTDLNEVLVDQPAATYFFTASGDGLAHVGIYAGDLLIVDRSVRHRLGYVIVVSTDNELVIGQYLIYGGKAALRTQHGGVQLLTSSTRIWGVVIRSVRTHLTHSSASTSISTAETAPLTPTPTASSSAVGHDRVTTPSSWA